MIWYKKNTNEVGRTVERVPQLQTAESPSAEVTTMGEEASRANERQAFNQEGTHEQLKSQYLDDASVKKRSSAGTDAGVTAVLAIPNQSYDTNVNQTIEPYGTWADSQDKVNSSYMKPAVAGVAVFVVVLILLFIFAR
jgi:flagellar biosynthesis/type III secretory pathway M-ring protein FliF/YscJ